MWRGFGKSRADSATTKAASIAITKPNEPPTPSVVNVHINLDPRAIGDYVQQLKKEEVKGPDAICPAATGSPPASPQKGATPIENVADGFDIISKTDVVETEGVSEPEEAKKEK